MNFYRAAASALDHLDKYQGSVKGSLAAAKIKAEPAEAKRILALVIETLKCRAAPRRLLT
jgi:putative methyltransferase